MDNKSDNLKEENLEDILSAFQTLKSEFSTSAADTGVISVKLPIRLLLNLMPSSYLTADAKNISGDEKVAVEIPDLIERMKKGKVEIRVSELASFIPANYVMPQALDDDNFVRLPLQEVVMALGPDFFKGKSAGKLSVTIEEADTLPDPFRKIAVEEKKSAEKEKKEEKEIKEHAMEEKEKISILQQEKSDAMGKVELTVKKQETVKRYFPQVRFKPVNGINVNDASMEELISVPGLTERIAENIVKYRNEKGRIEDIFDLINVPGIGKNIFRKITGMSYSTVKRHRAFKLAKLIKIQPDEIGDLKLVGRGVVSLEGITGFIVSDLEGFKIIEAGDVNAMNMIAGLGDKILKSINEIISSAGITTVTSCTLHMIGNNDIRIDKLENLIVISVLDSRGIKRTVKKKLELIVKEIGWLMSKMLYV